jgi:hypothetical protein
MALINPTKIWLRQNDVVAYEWVMEEGDTAISVEVPNKSDKTVQVSGTFGSATVTVQGSVDQAAGVFNDLRDPQGNTISVTSADIVTVLENVAFIQPVVSGGSGTSVTIRIYMR